LTKLGNNFAKGTETYQYRKK